jgi:phosphatidylglycerophosphate synthase
MRNDDPQGAQGERSRSLLSHLDHRFASVIVRHVPAWIGTQHLTLLTVVWSGLTLLLSYLVKTNPRCLIGLCAVICLQYVTDAIDGKIGILRNAGLVRWGHYMDHFLDYVFLTAILIGYGLMLPDDSRFLMTWAVAIGGGFMVSAFLEHAAVSKLSLSFVGIGPVEMRLVFIGINLLLLTYGRASLLTVVPTVLGIAGVILVWHVYAVQRRLWHMDVSVQQVEASKVILEPPSGLDCLAPSPER